MGDDSGGVEQAFQTNHTGFVLSTWEHHVALAAELVLLLNSLCLHCVLFL